MQILIKKITAIINGQKGFTLLETLTALALLAILGVVFYSSIATSSITMASAEEKVQIDNLARAQFEYTKKCEYVEYIYGSPDTPPDYTTLDELDPTDPYAITLPDGYSIDVAAVALHVPDAGVQQITVNISRDGESLLVIEGYKLNR
ncbi:MAG: prepilin-type N-terminal cleavage/methylation domain-containing protein [Dehalococcoidales bacterium]|nr:MAG: prepilin-type N-terminal cleavage/methylation domain-containing protein [Dehalococcoidales bacterium]